MGLRQTNRSKYHRNWNLGVIAILGIGLVGTGCSRGEAEAANTEQAEESANIRIVNVEVTPVSEGEFAGFITVTGEVEAYYDVTISAEESGRVQRFLVDKGQRVRQGQTIAKLEDDMLSAQVDEARASARLAREEYERQKTLWEQDSIGTEMGFLQRQYASEMASARLSLLEARLRRTEISSPVSGTFDDKFLEIGEMATPGAPVVRVVATDRVKVVAGVPERYARSVGVGDEARVSFDIFPDRVFTGRVGFAGASVDPRNRTFRIEVVLDNPDGIMKPAMVATMQVERERLSDVVSVPQQVVLRSAEGYKVFVAESEGSGHMAKARTVTLGPTSGDYVVIDSGLEVGDLLITVGHQLVDDNSRIRLVNDSQLGNAQEEN